MLETTSDGPASDVTDGSEVSEDSDEEQNSAELSKMQDSIGPIVPLGGNYTRMEFLIIRHWIPINNGGLLVWKLQSLISYSVIVIITAREFNSGFYL